METKKVVIAKNAPNAVGAYTHANIINGIVFTAGQIGLDPITNQMVEGDITAEATRVMENLKAILEESGSSCEKVLKATIYLTDLADFAAVDSVYKKYITSNFPGRTCVEVKGIPKGGHIEIDMIASL